MKTHFSLLLILLIFSISIQPAHAYIDPGSGSAILSAIIGFLVAVGLAIKTYWYKLKSLFIRKKESEESEESD